MVQIKRKNIIGIKLQPIPTSLRSTFPLSMKKIMLKNNLDWEIKVE